MIPLVLYKVVVVFLSVTGLLLYYCIQCTTRDINAVECALEFDIRISMCAQGHIGSECSDKVEFQEILTKIKTISLFKSSSKACSGELMQL